uniref:Uncharacterized protein n=1 Tax=Mola mola TaxID=94237 RepID=A0A3Q3XDM5_MOLML
MSSLHLLRRSIPPTKRKMLSKYRCEWQRSRERLSPARSTTEYLTNLKQRSTAGHGHVRAVDTERTASRCKQKTCPLYVCVLEQLGTIKVTENKNADCIKNYQNTGN